MTLSVHSGRSRLWRLTLSLAATLSLVLGLTPAAVAQGAGQGQQPAAQDDPHPPIRLKADTFRPSRGERPDIPPGQTIAGYERGQRGYYLVQFEGPVQEAWKAEVAATGAELIDYIPEYAFKVRMNPGQAERVERQQHVIWVGLFHPAYKLDPQLTVDGERLYAARVEDGADAAAAAAEVDATGATVVGREGLHLLVAAEPGELEDVAHVLDVAWVDDFRLPERHNEYGAGQIVGGAAANAKGYDGSTQTVAVADTGLGDGTKAGAHPDGIPSSRITSIRDWTTADNFYCYDITPDGPQDVDSGHGTHVSASVLGDGGPAGEGRGTAPAANLVFQAVEDHVHWQRQCNGLYPDGYYLMGLPEDLRTFFQQAYDDGARIHSNSWGVDDNGAYSVDSANTDDFVWNNPDMTVTFSAGNAGEDANGDGAIDNDSIGSPATAKNVITVGASENERPSYPCDTNLLYTSHDAYQSGQTCTTMGGDNHLGTYGQRWGYPTNPIKDDVTAGNAEQMAAFSSRGPIDDGRMKPDIVAPGTWILSGFSGLFQEGYGDPTNPQNGLYQWDGWGMPADGAYKWMGGTSMSNPIAAGGAAVVRDYYQKAHTHPASAALTKATLINSATDLLDENNDGADDNDFPIPNVHEGWGRVDLVNATDGSAAYVDDTAGLATGQTATDMYDVAAGAPLKVSLVWSDAASTETAAKNLVNDLDLVVTAPDGTTTYLGNVFGAGWSTAGGSADTTNNVENVYIASPAAGTWSVAVSGASVGVGTTQPFALVVDHQTDTPPTVAVDNPLDGATGVSGTVTVQVGASDVEDVPGTLTAEWELDGSGTWQAMTYNADTSKYEASWDSTAVSNGPHTIVARVSDSGGNESTDTSVFDVSNESKSFESFEVESESAFEFFGEWRRWSDDSQDVGQSGGAAMITNRVGGQVEVLFEGTSVRWVGQRGPNRAVGEVVIDGVSHGEVDTYAVEYADQEVLFEATGLGAGQHRLVIELTGRNSATATSSPYLIVDALEVEALRS